VDDGEILEQVAGAMVAGQGSEAGPGGAAERHRVTDAVGVAGAGRLRPRSAGTTGGADGGGDGPHRGRRDAGLVGEQDDRDLDRAIGLERGDARHQRGRLPVGVVGVDHHLHRAGGPGGGGDGSRVVTDDDHDPVDLGGEGGRDRVSDERSSRVRRELLRAPVARPRTRRQHDDRDRRALVRATGRPGPRLGPTPGRTGVDREVVAVDRGGERWTAAVVTASDGVASGHRQDGSGAAVSELLAAAGFEVVRRVVTPDDRAAIAGHLRALADDTAVALVAVTGGTGFGPRDVTPEATLDVVERPAPGLAEAMRAAGRAITPLADLSRGVCGVRGRTLIIDLPGSPKGATESLAAIVELLPHALDLLGGDTQHHPGGHGDTERSG
jgi:molybdopterin adenylyltransferase